MAKNQFAKVRTKEEEAVYDAWCRKHGGFSHANPYMVSYWGTNADGFSERVETFYFANGKRAHGAVRKRFLKDHPSATIIRVCYD